MNWKITFATVAATVLTGTPAFAQQPSTRQDPIDAILGTLFGTGNANSLDAQWAIGQTPLTNQRYQFESRVDAEVRAGTISQATAARLKSDYAALVELETRYGSDRRFTTAERTELANRYRDLTNVLTAGGYSDGATATAEVSDGRAEFESRVNAAVTARRISRTQATRLKTDYAAVVQVEADYLRDGVISATERDDLDSRLDALDARLGDTNYAAAPVLTPRQRLDAIAQALPASGLTSSELAQLRVEQEDLSRLESAYSRLTASAEERAYLERRVGELETRARIRR